MLSLSTRAAGPLVRHSLNSSLQRFASTWLSKDEIISRLKTESAKNRALPQTRGAYENALNNLKVKDSIVLCKPDPVNLVDEARRKYWASCAKQSFTTSLTSQTAIILSDRDPTIKKSAIVIGSQGIHTAIRLAALGWEVNIVECSPEVQQILKDKAKERPLNEEQMSRLIFQDPSWIPEDGSMSLVVAEDWLSLVEPELVLKVWNRILESLAPNGIFTGNFSFEPKDPGQALCQRQIGKWHADEVFVRSLVVNTGCKGYFPVNNNNDEIEFVAEKQNQ